MRRKLYSLLPPKAKRRRSWAVLIRCGAGRRIQVSAQTPHRKSAAEFAEIYIRERLPHLRHKLDLNLPAPRHSLSQD